MNEADLLRAYGLLPAGLLEPEPESRTSAPLPVKHTISRFMRDALGLRKIQVEGWEATFVVRRTGPPVRVGKWRPR